MEDARQSRKCQHDQSAATVEVLGVYVCEGQGVSRYLVGANWPAVFINLI